MSASVSIVTEYSEELHASFARLTPQLADIRPPTKKHLQQLVDSNSVLFVLKNEEAEIIGTLTLGVYYIPTDTRAWVEDVIVDHAYRGQGLSKLLMQAAHQHATEVGIQSINLTSHPSRVAANQLYQQVGYQLRETNSYRIHL